MTMTTTDVPTDATASPKTLRRALLGIFLLGVLGGAGELVLLEHYEDPWQMLPLGLFGLSILVIGFHGISASALSIRAFRLTMLLFIASGFIGSWMHYQSKAEFKRQLDPSLSGMNLFREALKGQMPPILAPGMMIHLGLVGLAWTWRHPATFKTSQKSQSEG
jgi:hypothetical protein